MVLSLSVLIVLFLLIVFYEQKVRKWNFFSPVVLLGGPLILLILLSCIISPLMGFIMVNAKALHLWILGLSCFWMGGLFVSPLYPFVANKKVYVNFYLRNSTRRFLNGTGFVFICIMMLVLRSLLANRTSLLLEDQEFAHNGIEAHIGGLLMGYLMFYIICFWEKFSVNKGIALFFVVAIFFLKMLSGVRGNVILPLIGAGIYLAIKGHIKITLKYIILSFLAVFLLFMLPTLFFNVDDGSNFDFLFSYFVFYFMAGVLGLSAYMGRDYIPWEINPDFVYTFFVNLYIKLFGEGNYLSLINPEFVPVTTFSEFGYTSNVYTLIGEVYINCGYIIGSLFLFILGGYSYFLFFISSKGVMLMLLYSFVGSCLFLGIFSQYVLMPYFYEIQVLFVFLYFVSKSTIRKSRLAR